MPTTELQKRWTNDKQQGLRVVQVANALLHGAHNEVHDFEVDPNHTLSRFPASSQITIILTAATTPLTGLAVGDVRFTTLAAHGLVEGDVAVITASAGGAYDGSHTITNVQSSTTFDVTVTWTATSAGFLSQGFVNDRITPDTVALITPTHASAANLYIAGIYQTAFIGGIHFFTTSSGTTDAFKLILFGD